MKTVRRLALPALILAALTFAVWLSPIAPLSRLPYPARAQVVCGGVTYSFVNGTIADATQVNSDFTALVACINAGNTASLPQTATYASLKALTGGVYPLVYRRAEATEGDGGNAYYYWSQASTCTDDVGSCVAPNVGGGRWLLIPQPPMNPMIWGQASNPIRFSVQSTGADTGYCLTLGSACATAAYAVTQSAKFNPNGGQVFIDVGIGETTKTFTGNLSVSGAGFGFVATTPFINGALSVPMLIINGNGHANTKLLGQNIIGGLSYCYTVLSQHHAAIGLQNLSVQADSGGGSCLQSDLYVERSASMYALADVWLLAATGNLITEEDGARFYTNPGGGAALTLAGNAGANGVAIDGQSLFWGDNTIGIANNPVFSGGSMFAGAYGSTFKLTGNPAVTSAATIGGSRFTLSLGSMLYAGTPPATWPGTIGTVDYGSRYQGTDNGSCIGGTAGCNNVTTSTALGVGGSYAIVAGSSSYGGEIQITMGANALAGGTVQLGFDYVLSSGICTFGVAAGTGSWNVRAVASRTSGPVGFTGVAVDWDNNSVALTNGLTYGITYNCTTPH